MRKRSVDAGQSLAYVTMLLALVGLYLSSLYSYLLFHSLAEIFSAVIASSVFMVAWTSRRQLDNNYLLFLGPAYLSVAVLAMIHTLAYKGMGVFPGDDANLATQLWIASRYILGISFLLAPLFLHRRTRLDLAPVFAIYLVATILLLASIFVWRIFPVCYDPETGLTPFKRISEYVVSGLFVVGLVLLNHDRRFFDAHVLRLLSWSLVVSILSELAFTNYVAVYDLFNLAGHLLQIVGLYLLYRAIIETGLVRPYALLFHNLREARDKLELRVRERTAELTAANAALAQANTRLEQTNVELAAANAQLEETNTQLEEANAQLAQSQESLRRLSRRLVEVQEAERRAIARELHDEAGQTLTALHVGLGLLQREAGGLEPIASLVRELKQIADGVQESLHQLAWNLRPPSLDRMGLVPTLRQYTETVRRQHGLQLDFVAFDLDGLRPAAEVEIAAYRIVQEAITNVVRHAGASRAGVILERHGDRLRVIVEDDGRGFDPEEAAGRGRLGLFGMRERAEMMGGTLTLESRPGAGATVYAELPLDFA